MYYMVTVIWKNKHIYLNTVLMLRYLYFILSYSSVLQSCFLLNYIYICILNLYLDANTFVVFLKQKWMEIVSVTFTK